MKITVQDLERKAREAAEARDEIKEEEKRLFNETRDLNIQADEAADAGNLDLYLELKKKIETAAAKAYVRKRQLEKKDSPVTREEAASAWADYRADYEKKLSAKLTAVDKARSAFLVAYKDAVDVQADACATRQRLAKFLDQPGDVAVAFPMATIPERHGVDVTTVHLGAFGILDRDLAFAISNMNDKPVDLMNSAEARRYISVVIGHNLT